MNETQKKRYQKERNKRETNHQHQTTNGEQADVPNRKFKRAALDSTGSVQFSSGPFQFQFPIADVDADARTDQRRVHAGVTST